MQYAYSHKAEKNVANVSTDRILKLSVIEGKEALSSNRKGAFHMNAAFTKGTELHAIQDAGLWYLQYKNVEGYGNKLPEALKQRWTNFNQMYKWLTTYFAARNIKIEEVIA